LRLNKQGKGHEIIFNDCLLCRWRLASASGSRIFVFFIIIVISGVYPLFTFELTATIIIVLTGMIGMQKNYNKSKRSDLVLEENEVLEKKDSVEQNVQEPTRPIAAEVNDESQVEGLTRDRKKRKQEQLQKLTSMIKTMSKKGQTKDQIRNNLSQMGWPEEALNQTFAASV